MFTNPTWGKHDNMTLFYPQKKSLAISGTDSIYKAYCLGPCKGIYPQNMAFYGTVPPF